MPLPAKKAKMRRSFSLKGIQETVSPQNMSQTRSEIHNLQLKPAVLNVHVSYLWFPDALRMYRCSVLSAFLYSCIHVQGCGIVACDQFNVGKTNYHAYHWNHFTSQRPVS